MLTDADCKNAKCPPEKKRERFADSGGLYLEVSPNGARRWFWKYRKQGKEGRMALGSYPAVGLKDARAARDTAKNIKAGGFDPVQERKVGHLKAAANLGETFELVAREWYDRKSPGWSEPHCIRELRNLNKDLIPWLGARKVGDVDTVELLATVRRVEARGALDVAHRVLGTARGVLAYAVATGRANRNVALDLAGALTPHRTKHFAAITEPAKLAELLRAIRGYQGGPVVRTALQLAPVLFQRPNELRGMAWAELDLDAALWTIPAVRMKRTKHGKENGSPHVVPLPKQAVELLRELQPLTGHTALVFPGERGTTRPISDNTLRTALQTLGYASDVQTVHGFRATARTILAERLEFDPLIVEAQLAHAVKDANGRAYNRTSYIEQRRTMMQAWADYLDKLRIGADIIPLHGKAA
ncbi:MAG: integrase arm-type DNA-binding domain-containing protein [Burkholderiaceae bacterium]|nr:integrase arm-type DNA-binding domain-containing protein [Burkholderiaceae bacterium]